MNTLPAATLPSGFREMARPSQPQPGLLPPAPYGDQCAPKGSLPCFPESLLCLVLEPPWRLDHPWRDPLRLSAHISVSVCSPATEPYVPTSVVLCPAGLRNLSSASGPPPAARQLGQQLPHGSSSTSWRLKIVPPSSWPHLVGKRGGTGTGGILEQFVCGPEEATPH